MSRDFEFLHSTLKEMGEEDEFIKNYLEISKKAYNFPKRQKLQLGIFRNDFMIDKVKKFIYQIEINTIASSMGAFSDGLKKFFLHFSKKYPQYFEQYFNIENSSYSIPLEKDNVIDKISNSINTAVNLFSPELGNKTLVVFIVQENERNEYDQRAIEAQLWDKQ